MDRFKVGMSIIRVCMCVCVLYFIIYIIGYSGVWQTKREVGKTHPTMYVLCRKFALRKMRKYRTTSDMGFLWYTYLTPSSRTRPFWWQAEYVKPSGHNYYWPKNMCLKYYLNIKHCLHLIILSVNYAISNGRW